MSSSNTLKIKLLSDTERQWHHCTETHYFQWLTPCGGFVAFCDSAVCRSASSQAHRGQTSTQLNLDLCTLWGRLAWPVESWHPGGRMDETADIVRVWIASVVWHNINLFLESFKKKLSSHLVRDIKQISWLLFKLLFVFLMIDAYEFINLFQPFVFCFLIDDILSFVGLSFLSRLASISKSMALACYITACCLYITGVPESISHRTNEPSPWPWCPQTSSTCGLQPMDGHEEERRCPKVKR